jgi:dTDP-4-amino-4,6-dideoxygalactose transaminase
VYGGLHLAALPVTEKVSEEVLSLPIWPQMTLTQQDEVVEKLKRCFVP